MTTRRNGRWVYESGRGWVHQSSGTVLDFDRLDRSTGSGGRDPASRGCWVLEPDHEPIDHYLDNAMDWVESERAEGTTP